MKTIRAVIFDIGGVLEMTPPTGWVARWEARLGLSPGELDERLGQVWTDGSAGAISIEQVENSIGQILGIERAQVDALVRDLWDEYLGQLNAELAAFLAGLRPRYRTALLSNSFAGARQKEEERYHFCHLCDLVIYSHEEGMEKPDPRFFLLACERLGVQPDEVVFVDDVEALVAAARELGMQGILFRDTAQAIAEVEACLEDRLSRGPRLP